jgi:hypothetical protein
MPPKARRLAIDSGVRCGTLEQAGSPVLSFLRTAAGVEGTRHRRFCPEKANGPHSIQLCGPHTPTLSVFDQSR